MNKCDKCENKGRYVLTGYSGVSYLCASCAANLCASVGDTVGRDKFAALISGDGLAA